MSPTANFVTCNHCSTRLAIHRTESAAFTEVLENLAESANRLSSQVDRIAIQNDIERLDRDFETKYGDMPKKASVAGSIFTAGFLTVWGLVWCGISGTMTLVAASQIHPLLAIVPGGMFVLGLAVLIGGFGGQAKEHSAAATYRKAERRYQAQRAELLVQLEDAR